MNLRPFQRRFISAVEAQQYDTLCLSLSRGNGKSFIAAHIIERALTPGDALFVDGQDVVLVSGSLEQARIVFKYVRDSLEPTGGFRWIDSVTRIGATHIASNSKFRVLSSNAKTAFGLVNVPLVVADEPGAWEVTGGTLLFDALTGAQGKPGSPLKIIIVGTLAPATSGWWHDLIDRGTRRTTYVQALQGARETWDDWHTIRKCNPLVEVSADFRRKLLEERDDAREDSRLKARFLSYRLNVPSSDESVMLLTVPDFERWSAREAAERVGPPLVAVDLGGGRAWSAAVAIYPSGRAEAMAVAPGVPGIHEQERRDRVPSGTYARLVESGSLDIAEGLRVQPPAALWRGILDRWGKPSGIVCDRFRISELQDAVRGACSVEPRVSRWSESSFDIRSLRKLVLDGGLTLDPGSNGLMAASLSAAMVKNDDAGNVRLVKRGMDNAARDDVGAALVLGAGAFKRREGRTSGGYLGLV